MNNERDQILFEMEQQLAQVGRPVTAEDAGAMIADDFVEFGASGRTWTKQEILGALASWKPIERNLDDFTVRELDNSLCLVTYKATGAPGHPRTRSLRSSIWRKRGETWQLVFHQGTPIRD
jgi:hypothetical protein